ncbi:hypothetical protein DB88DRAFT_480527 [Papiliotrema laurentii]|uniref:RPA43 OB domain-containing protein n=1 Tax=Papiliotrema laurentii TaxID=5418 RepID=A0AAD9FTJ7_PAPLA|nr:hypothetical protein DB88DRAFT_480527 [Papiliotrema laurentii]
MSSPNAHASSSRDPTKHKKKSKSKDKDGHKHKHKHRDHDKSSRDKSSSSSSSSSKSSPFEHRTTRMRLSIPPKYALDWLSGVREVLDGMLMRYVPQLEGVLLAHWDHKFCDDTVKIIDECPYGVGEVEFKTIVWAPKVGQKLYGTHSLSSPSHLSLLFARTFNVSIPLQHIPQDLYKFEHTDLPEEEDDSDSEDEDAMDAVEEVGRWRNVQTGKLVGEEGIKGIEFTVIGMRVDNNILSLTGSLLADPTKPPPPPSPVVPVRAPSPSPSLSPEPEPSRPVKQPRINKAAPPAAAAAAQPEAIDTIDERFLSARELKKRRKDEEKRKRDARKARKEERTIEAVEEVGAEALVHVQGVVPELESAGAKRKAEDDDGEGKKKRKVTDA